MIPLKMRRLFFGFTPRRLLGINGSILAHCPSLNQNKFARICWPPDSVTNPLNLNMVNWVLTLGNGVSLERLAQCLGVHTSDHGTKPAWSAMSGVRTTARREESAVVTIS